MDDFIQILFLLGIVLDFKLLIFFFSDLILIYLYKFYGYTCNTCAKNTSIYKSIYLTKIKNTLVYTYLVKQRVSFMRKLI